MSLPPAYHADPSAPPAYSAVSSAASNNSFSFTLNRKVFTMDAAKISPNMTLAQFIRSETKWRGTKVCCQEGGCGACTVALTYQNQDTNATATRAVHSCLRPLLACNGMSVETNDGLEGSAAHGGYNVIQDRLAKANGSQCGYCSNGWVMTMHALMAANPTLTPLQIEREFDGNLCRCTGYRPILDAMKSFATTTEEGEPIIACRKTGCKNRHRAFADIEDIPGMYDEHETLSREHERPKQVVHQGSPAKLAVSTSGSIWQDCPTLTDLDYWLTWYSASTSSVMLVVGQTSLGVHKVQPEVKLNIARIPELHGITSNATDGITFGAAVSIHDVLDYLRTVTAPSGEEHKVAHFAQASAHLHRVANQMIRNIACVVGNLFLSYHSQKWDNPFTSDASTVLFGLGTTLEMYDPVTKKSTSVGMNDFYTGNWKGQYCKSFTIPWGKKNEYFMSYKIAIRQVNSHALVNAAMRAVVDPTTHKVTSQPTILYGGITAMQERISTVETALLNSDVTKKATLTTLLPLLDTAIVPSSGSRTAFRKQVAINMFYKFYLLLQPSLSPDLQSATAAWFDRPLSSGTQSMQPNPGEYPVSAPIPKVESWQQTSGKAIYTDDIPPMALDTLHAHLVQAAVGACELDTIDITQAALVPGFAKFISGADMPKAQNAWQNGQLLATSEIGFAGQYLGIVLATTLDAAVEAAKKVKVTYKNKKTPVTTIDQSIAQNLVQPGPPFHVEKGDATTAITNAKNKTTVTVDVGYQYHIHMENHVSYVVPKEDKLEVTCATQAPTMVQSQVSASTGLPNSKIIVNTKRCGGGYGGKIANSLPGSALAAYCAQTTGQPVRLITDLQQSMKGLGNRGAHKVTFTVAYDDDGTMTALDASVWGSSGNAATDAIGTEMVLVNSLDNSYNFKDGVLINSKMMKLNIPPATAVRGPGWVTAVAVSELIVSAVASAANVSPEQVREKSMYKKGDTTADNMKLRFWNMPTIWEQLKTDADLTKRKADIVKFNAGNRWIKKGINMSPCRFGAGLAGANFDSVLNIFGDGTISVTIGGCEIGQGINTKIIQVVAMKFGLDLDFAMANITVDETSTRCISAGSNVTGGSITSGMCALSAMHACETINNRLAPFRKAGQKWQSLIATAAASGVELTATGWSNAPPNMDGGIFNYNSTSAACCEVMINVLTGEFEITRADLLFDCGISMSPMIDVGQVEGGFMFGIGYHTMESVDYDATTGESQDHNTWTYKIPSAYDVPIELNTTFLRNAPNPLGVLSAKIVGEPGVALAACVIGALEDAITEALRAADPTAKRFHCTSLPLQVDKIQQACGVKASDYTF